MANEGAKLKAWREGLNLSQEDVARLAKVSRITVVRAEKSGKLNDALRGVMKGSGLPQSPPLVEEAAPKARKAKAPSTPIDEALARSPLFARTTAEARAMREELFRRAQAKNKDALESRLPLIPLRPEWQTVQAVHFQSGKPMGEPFKVNAAIPEPTVRSRRHPRGVATKSGRLYDFETAEPLAG